MSFRNNISSSEAENFLKNLNAIMQENWLSQNSIADKMYPVHPNGNKASDSKRAAFGNYVKKIKEGTPPTLKFVNKVATALGCSAESLLADTVTKEINKAGKDFVDEAIRKRFNRQKFSAKTGIPQGDLARIINRGIDKFNVEQINVLLEKNINFKLPTLIPFATKDIDIVSLVEKYAPLKPANVYGSTLDWVYQRKAISQAAFNQGININQLSLKTGLTTDYLKDNILWKPVSTKNADKLFTPPETTRNMVLSALGLDNISKQNLILMGKYSLTSDQLNELIQCERLFNHYAKKIAAQKSGIAAITGEDVYQFYLGIKHQFHSAGTAFNDAIPQVIKNIGWGKFVVFTSVLLTSLIKSIPVAAAEAVADFGIEKLDQNAKETENLMNKLLNVFSSSLLKSMLLVSKGLGAAITTPFPENSNAFTSLLQLPVDMVTNFIEADGYNQAVLNDWKEITNIISSLIDQNQKVADSNRQQHEQNNDDVYSDERDYIVNSAETIYIFSKAVLVGAAQGIAHGVIGIIESLAHPIDNVLYPISSFLYDATLISAGHLNANNIPNVSHDDLMPIDTAMHAVNNNPKIYHNAVSRMDGRINALNKAGNDFANAPWSEQVRMASMAASSIATNIYAPGLMINSVKAIINLQKIGVPFKPPSFHEWQGHKPTTFSFPTYTLMDIRAMPGTKAYIFVITEMRQLIIAPMSYMRDSKILNPLGESLTKVEIHHHDLAQGRPILSGGELLFKDGIMTDMIGKSGHYLPEGFFLKKFTERVFKENGYTEATGKFSHVQVITDIFKGSGIKVSNNDMNPLPKEGVAAGVVNIIADAVKQPVAEQDNDVTIASDGDIANVKIDNQPDTSSHSSINNTDGDSNRTGGSFNFIFNGKHYTENVSDGIHEFNVVNEKSNRYQINFKFNGQNHTLEVGHGLEINVGAKNNSVVSTSCKNEVCDVTLRAGDDKYTQIQVPYKPLSNNTALSTLYATPTDSGRDCLQNHITALSKTSSSSSLALTGSSHSIILGHLQNLQDNQNKFNLCLESTRCENYSKFTNPSPPIRYVNTKKEADRLNIFGFNFFSGKFCETPKLESNQSFSFFGGESNGGGKSGHCDSRYQNCGSSSSNDCRSGDSKGCSSSLF